MSGLMIFITIYLLTIMTFKWIIDSTTIENKLFLMQEKNLTEEQYDNLFKWIEIVALIPVINTAILIIVIIRKNVY